MYLLAADYVTGVAITAVKHTYKVPTLKKLQYNKYDI